MYKTVKIFNDKILDELLKYLIVYADGIIMTLTILISILYFCFTYWVIDSNIFSKIVGAFICTVACFIFLVFLFNKIFKWYIPETKDSLSKSQLWYMKKEKTNESW